MGSPVVVIRLVTTWSKFSHDNDHHKIISLEGKIWSSVSITQRFYHGSCESSSSESIPFHLFVATNGWMERERDAPSNHYLFWREKKPWNLFKGIKIGLHFHLPLCVRRMILRLIPRTFGLFLSSLRSLWHFSFSRSPHLQLQIIGYNSDLYQNMTDAQNRANGLVGIALLIQVRTDPLLKNFSDLITHNTFSRCIDSSDRE